MSSYQVGGSIIKSWDNKSIFGGLNFTRPTVTGVSGEKILTVMGTGFHAGYGYDFDEKMSVELLLKRAAFQFYETADNNSFSIDYSNIYSDGLQIQTRFRF